jgi:hypothetical protein
MPYGYYQFVRFAAMVGFSYLAYSANEQHHKNEMFLYIALAIFFNLLSRSPWAEQYGISWMYL